MEENLMFERVVSVDLGFSHTKGRRRTYEKFRQPSVTGYPRKLHEQDVRGDDIIFGNENDHQFEPQYFVGNLAVRQSNIRYYGTGDDKPGTWTSVILLESALNSLAKDNEEIVLVTGLPIDFYFKQRESMTQFLRHLNTEPKHHIKFGNSSPIESRPNIVKSLVTLQPMGAAMNYLLDEHGQFNDKLEANNVIVVGDIGFHTFDLLVLDGMEIHRYSHSDKEISIANAYTAIQDWLRTETGSTPDLYELDYYVRRGDFRGIPLKNQFDKAMEALARQAKLALESLNLTYHRYISTGGWAHVITPLMGLPKETTVIYDQDGNIDGYEKIGVRSCLAK